MIYTSTSSLNLIENTVNSSANQHQMSQKPPRFLSGQRMFVLMLIIKSGEKHQVTEKLYNPLFLVQKKKKKAYLPESSIT